MIEVRRLGPQIGVEARGVDVKTLDDAGFATLYRAWLDGNVLVVPDQELEIEDFLRYSRRFGAVVPHPSKMTRHPDFPEITMLGVNKFTADGELDQAVYRRGAEGWHTDGAYDQEPFKATQLYALAVPSRGGDTLFASMYAAYDALPDAASASASTAGWARSRTVARAQGHRAPRTPRTATGCRCSIRCIRDPSRDRAQGPLLRSRQDPAHRRARRPRRATR